MQISRPLQSLAFFPQLKGKSVQFFFFWGGVICFQRTHISEIFEFYVIMNTCYFCNQKKKKKTLEHLEGYIRINKQVRAVCFDANLWVQRKKGREKEEENGSRQRSQLIKMLVLLSHCPWIL